MAWQAVLKLTTHSFGDGYKRESQISGIGYFSVGAFSVRRFFSAAELAKLMYAYCIYNVTTAIMLYLAGGGRSNTKQFDYE